MGLQFMAIVLYLFTLLLRQRPTAGATYSIGIDPDDCHQNPGRLVPVTHFAGSADITGLSRLERHFRLRMLMLRDIAIFIFLFFLLVNSVSASPWECINRPLMSCNTWRMSVPGGWIVGADNVNDEHTFAMTFFPDPKHEWSL